MHFLQAYLYSSYRYFTFYYELAAQYHHVIHQNLLKDLNITDVQFLVAFQ